MFTPCPCHFPLRERAQTRPIPLSEPSKIGFGGALYSTFPPPDRTIRLNFCPPILSFSYRLSVQIVMMLFFCSVGVLRGGLPFLELRPEGWGHSVLVQRFWLPCRGVGKRCLVSAAQAWRGMALRPLFVYYNEVFFTSCGPRRGSQPQGSYFLGPVLRVKRPGIEWQADRKPKTGKDWPKKQKWPTPRKWQKMGFGVFSLLFRHFWAIFSPCQTVAIVFFSAIFVPFSAFSHSLPRRLTRNPST